MELQCSVELLDAKDKVVATVTVEAKTITEVQERIRKIAEALKVLGWGWHLE